VVKPHLGNNGNPVNFNPASYANGNLEKQKMKKKVMIEQTFCDVCGKETSGYNSCISCGKEFCYDCMKTHAVEYSHGVYISGSGDGLYCFECDNMLRRSTDPLHRAYRKIETLRYELVSFSEAFEARKTTAEKELAYLIERNKK